MDAVDGFVAIKGNVIEAVGPRAAADAYVAHADRIIEVGERTVMPGMTDVHTFFSGWALLSLGCDLSRASNDEEGLSTFLQYAQGQHEESPLFGHGWKNELFSSDAEKKLTSCFPSRPVVAFTADRGTAG
jgi:predicted amidohydrolase YtcJ